MPGRVYHRLKRTPKEIWCETLHRWIREAGVHSDLLYPSISAYLGHILVIIILCHVLPG